VNELFPSSRLQILVPVPLTGTLSGPLDYLADDGLGLQIGDFVRVPLGGRTVTGVVWTTVADTSEVPESKLKHIQEKLDLPCMPDSLMQFIDWVSAYSMNPQGAVLKLALSVPGQFEEAKKTVLYKMSAAEENNEGLSPKRQKLADAAIGDMAMTVRDWGELANVGEGVVRGMIKSGQLLKVEIKGEAAYPLPDLSLNGPALSDEQKKAADHMREMVKAEKYSAALLEGITGSGKTEVYFEAIHEALQNPSGQVLVLVPEIALTTQWFSRFSARFGVEPVVWHSELTPAQRRRAWWNVAQTDMEKRARVVVGARSALFLPFQDLSLVVVDEEHSPTFKQEDGVFYHGRDMAVVRAHQADCPIVLASATPSIETLVNAQSGKYDWLFLGQRHGAASLPDIKAIDMRADPPVRGAWLSDPLRAALRQNLDQGQQSLLYLNRRGYAPLTLCRTCGHRIECPRCDAWLVEHRPKNRDYVSLQCHHCGFSQPKPTACPSCGAEDSLVACGPGVERIAEEVAEIMPDARLAVMASDEMATPQDMRNLIDQITDHEIDIVVGTQMATKGYHFPMLTLVGVVDADLGLSGGDPRAAERTWQQLEQVSGRAGRADHKGQVLFQTYNPDHQVIDALVRGDRDAFLDREANEREQQQMPPYGKLAAVILSGPDFQKVIGAAKSLAYAAPRAEDFVILGPTPAPLAYLNGKHRYRLLLKARKNVNVQKVMQNWLSSCNVDRNVRLQIDIDPISFF